MPSQEDNEIASKVLDASFRIHTNLGPGLLESVYEAALKHTLTQMGLSAVNQVPIPVVYEGCNLAL
jgi:GxxExxY protein